MTAVAADHPSLVPVVVSAEAELNLSQALGVSKRAADMPGTRPSASVLGCTARSSEFKSTTRQSRSAKPHICEQADYNSPSINCQIRLPSVESRLKKSASSRFEPVRT